MSEKKTYTPEQAFKLTGSFFYEIYDRCDELYHHRLEKEFLKYPILEAREISSDQLENIVRLATDMHWYIEWVEEWQMSIIRTHLCKCASEIETLSFSLKEILIIAYDMLEFKHARWNFDFIPILVVIRKVLQNDRLFYDAISLWNNLVDMLDKKDDLYDFSYYCYNDITMYEKLPPIKELEILTREQRLNLEISIRFYLENFIVH